MNNQGRGDNGTADQRNTRINLRSKPATNADDASESERDVERATSVEATAMVAQEYFRLKMLRILTCMKLRNSADVAKLIILN